MTHVNRNAEDEISNNEYEIRAQLKKYTKLCGTVKITYDKSVIRPLKEDTNNETRHGATE